MPTGRDPGQSRIGPRISRTELYFHMFLESTHMVARKESLSLLLRAKNQSKVLAKPKKSLSVYDHIWDKLLKDRILLRSLQYEKTKELNCFENSSIDTV